PIADGNEAQEPDLAMRPVLLGLAIEIGQVLLGPVEPVVPEGLLVSPAQHTRVALPLVGDDRAAKELAAPGPGPAGLRRGGSGPGGGCARRAPRRARFWGGGEAAGGGAAGPAGGGGAAGEPEASQAPASASTTPID